VGADGKSKISRRLLNCLASRSLAQDRPIRYTSDLRAALAVSLLPPAGHCPRSARRLAGRCGGGRRQLRAQMLPDPPRAEKRH